MTSQNRIIGLSDYRIIGLLDYRIIWDCSSAMDDGYFETSRPFTISRCQRGKQAKDKMWSRTIKMFTTSITEKNNANKTGAITQPCLVPLLTGNSYDDFPQE